MTELCSTSTGSCSTSDEGGNTSKEENNMDLDDDHFNPLIYFVCKLCRKAFPDVTELLSHKKLQHTKNELKGIQCIIFEERFVKFKIKGTLKSIPSCSTELISSNETAENIVQENHQDLMNHSLDPAPADSKTVILPKRPLVRVTRLTANEINSFLKKRSCTKTDDAQDRNLIIHTNQNDISNSNFNDCNAVNQYQVSEPVITTEDGNQSCGDFVQRNRASADLSEYTASHRQLAIEDTKVEKVQHGKPPLRSSNVDLPENPNSPIIHDNEIIHLTGPYVRLEKLTWKQIQSKLKSSTTVAPDRSFVGSVGQSTCTPKPNTSLRDAASTGSCQQKINTSSENNLFTQEQSIKIENSNTFPKNALINSVPPRNFTISNDTSPDAQKELEGENFTVANIFKNSADSTEKLQFESTRGDPTNIVSTKYASISQNTLPTPSETTAKIKYSENTICADFNNDFGTVKELEYHKKNCPTCSLSNKSGLSNKATSLSTPAIVFGHSTTKKTTKVSPAKVRKCPDQIRDCNRIQNVILFNKDSTSAAPLTITKENPVTCKLCTTELVTEAEFQNHCKNCYLHNKDRHIHCISCNKDFKNPQQLNFHLLDIHFTPENLPGTPGEFRELLTGPEIEVTIHNEGDDLPLVEWLVNRKQDFPDFILLDPDPTHPDFKISHIGYGVTCRLCTAKLRSEIEVKSHVAVCWTYNKNNHCFCVRCKKANLKSDQLLKHRRTVHSGKLLPLPPFFCIECNLEFQTQDELDLHENSLQEFFANMRATVETNKSGPITRPATSTTKDSNAFYPTGSVTVGGDHSNNYVARKTIIKPKTLKRIRYKIIKSVNNSTKKTAINCIAAKTAGNDVQGEGIQHQQIHTTVDLQPQRFSCSMCKEAFNCAFDLQCHNVQNYRECVSKWTTLVNASPSQRSTDKEFPTTTINVENTNKFPQGQTCGSPVPVDPIIGGNYVLITETGGVESVTAHKMPSPKLVNDDEDDDVQIIDAVEKLVVQKPNQSDKRSAEEILEQSKNIADNNKGIKIAPVSLVDWLNLQKDQNKLDLDPGSLVNVILLDPDPTLAVHSEPIKINKESPVTCKLCQAKLETEPDVKNHAENCYLHNKDRHIHCISCDKNFKYPQNLNFHLRNVHFTSENLPGKKHNGGELPVPVGPEIEGENCPNGDDGDLPLAEWLVKRKQHFPDLILLDPDPTQPAVKCNYIGYGTKCILCNRKLSSEIEVKSHVAGCWAYNKKNHRFCVPCKTANWNSEKLLNHRRISHSGKFKPLPPFFCIECNQEFGTKKELDLHEKSLEEFCENNIRMDLCSKKLDSIASSPTAPMTSTAFHSTGNLGGRIDDNCSIFLATNIFEEPDHRAQAQCKVRNPNIQTVSPTKDCRIRTSAGNTIGGAIRERNISKGSGKEPKRIPLFACPKCKKFFNSAFALKCHNDPRYIYITNNRNQQCVIQQKNLPSGKFQSRSPKLYTRLGGLKRTRNANQGKQSNEIDDDDVQIIDVDDDESFAVHKEKDNKNKAEDSSPSKNIIDKEVATVSVVDWLNLQKDRKCPDGSVNVILLDPDPISTAHSEPVKISTETPVTCKLCQTKLETEPDVKIHAGNCWLHNKDRHIYCTDCKISFKNPIQLKEHEKRKHSGTETEVEELDEGTTEDSDENVIILDGDPDLLPLGAWIQNRKRMFPDITLVDPDPTSDSYLNSVKSVKQPTRWSASVPLMCKLCRFKCRTENRMKCHLKICWAYNKQNHCYCIPCGIHFSSVMNLESHQRASKKCKSQPRAFLCCKWCPQEFKSQPDLKHHQDSAREFFHKMKQIQAELNRKNVVSKSLVLASVPSGSESNAANSTNNGSKTLVESTNSNPNTGTQPSNQKVQGGQVSLGQNYLPRYQYGPHYWTKKKSKSKTDPQTMKEKLISKKSCTFCSKSFLFPHTLENHIKTSHPVGQLETQANAKTQQVSTETDGLLITDLESPPQKRTKCATTTVASSAEEGTQLP